MKDTAIFTDHSETHRTYLCVYGTVGICLLGYAAMTARYIYHTGQLPWLDLLTEVVFGLFLLSVAMTRSTYELHEKELVVTTTSLFRTRKIAIPYSAIDGAFRFKVEPIKTIAYRHTYRMYGSMDKREIWSLVYNLPKTDKVARLLMKASEEFWEEFEKLLPGRIRVSRDEVLRHAYAHISGVDQKKNRKRARKAAAAAAAAGAAGVTAAAATADDASAEVPEDMLDEEPLSEETAHPAEDETTPAGTEAIDDTEDALDEDELDEEDLSEEKLEEDTDDEEESDVDDSDEEEDADDTAESEETENESEKESSRKQ